MFFAPQSVRVVEKQAIILELTPAYILYIVVNLFNIFGVSGMDKKEMVEVR